MKKQLYLIQGIIFQNGNILGTAYKPGIGVAVSIQKVMIYAICNGIVGPSAVKEIYNGHMTDKWGESGITDFKISDTELSFTKNYANRPPIEYYFDKKEGNIWLGSYQGRDCGTGDSKFIVTEINESFFEPSY